MMFAPGCPGHGAENGVFLLGFPTLGREAPEGMQKKNSG